MARSRLLTRIAAGTLATALATAGLAIVGVTPASAGTISGVTPNFAFNEGDVAVKFRTQQTFAVFNADPIFGFVHEIYLTRQGPPYPVSSCVSPPEADNICPSELNVIYGSVEQDPDGTVGRDFIGHFSLGAGSSDAPAPASPNSYDLTLTETRPAAGGGTTTISDSCSLCFTVLSKGAPTITNTSVPTARPGQTITPFTINGTNFTRGTSVEILLGGTVDPTIRVFAQDYDNGPGGIFADADPNPDTAVQMTKELEVLQNSPGGVRDIRVTNSDFTTSVCSRCLTIDSLFVDVVNPPAVDNIRVHRLAIQGRRITAGATISLIRFPALPEQPEIVGTNVILTDNGTTQQLSADFDMTGAAPGQNAYLVRVTNVDGGIGTWPGRLSVGGGAPAASSVSPPSAQVGTDDAPAALIGNNLARGAKITFSGAGVSAAPGSIRWVSLTRLEFLVDVASNAAPGKFDVTVTNTDGQTATCTACFEVTAAPASPEPSPTPSETGGPAPRQDDGLYTPLDPSRIVDTREGVGSVRSPLAPGESRSFIVRGQGGVPANATAVAMNVTAIEPTASGFVTVFPALTQRPNASNINFVRGDVIANLVVVKIGSNGRVNIYNNSGNTHIAADVVGYFAAPEAAPSPSASAEPSASGSASGSAAPATPEPSASPTGGTTATPGGRYSPLNPQRILDTRDGNGGETRAIGPGESRQLQVTGRLGVPADATAVVFNMTAVTPTASGYLTAYPTGTERPIASNINFRRGEVIANLVMVRVGDNGRVSIYNNSGDTHTAADIVGYYSPSTSAASYTAVDPRRILDTRNGDNSPMRPIGPGESRSFRVTNLGGVASNATAVVFNLTAITPTASGFLTAYPAGTQRPIASNINFVRGDVIANLVVVRVGNAGQVTLFNNSGNTHAAADVVGYFAPFNPNATPTANPSPTTASPSATGTPSATASATPSASAATSGTPSATPSTVLVAAQRPVSGGDDSTAATTVGGLLLLGLVGGAINSIVRTPGSARRH